MSYRKKNHQVQLLLIKKIDRIWQTYTNSNFFDYLEKNNIVPAPEYTGFVFSVMVLVFHYSCYSDIKYKERRYYTIRFVTDNNSLSCQQSTHENCIDIEGAIKQILYIYILGHKVFPRAFFELKLFSQIYCNKMFSKLAKHAYLLFQKSFLRYDKCFKQTFCMIFNALKVLQFL